MLKNLRLDRPLVFIDLETTGTDVDKDRIVEFCFTKIGPGDYEEFTLHHFVNPGVLIAPEATAVHGITNEAASTWQPFSAFARTALFFLDGCDLAGFGIKRFDLKLLVNEFRRCDLEFKLAGRRIIDAMEIYHQRERRNLESAVQFYLGQEMQGAHQAEVDVHAAIDVLEAQIERYGLPNSIAELAAAARKEGEMDIAGNFLRDGHVVRFNFGKHKGQSLMAVPIGYLTWFLGESFFDDAKAIVQFEFDRRQAINRERDNLFNYPPQPGD